MLENNDISYLKKKCLYELIKSEHNYYILNNIIHIIYKKKNIHWRNNFVISCDPLVYQNYTFDNSKWNILTQKNRDIWRIIKVCKNKLDFYLIEYLIEFL